MYYPYLDWTYIVLVLPAVLFAMWASFYVQTTFRRYSSVPNSRGMTGAQAARMLLDANGLHQVRVVRISGNLTDHYDPKQKVIRLSDSVYDARSCAAVGVACHEAGHAVQDATDYAPLRFRNAIIPATNIGSKLSLPLIVIGLLLVYVSQLGIYIAYLGVTCFALSTIFQLVTLPTEFNASRRAVQALEDNGVVADEELRGTKRVLRAAALTYVAALAVSLMQLLRLLIIIGNSDNRRRR